MQNFIQPQTQTKQDLAGNQKFTTVQSGMSTATLPSPSAPSHQDIANRAYEIYVKNDCKDGRCNENWKQAEMDLRSQNPPEIKKQQACQNDATASARSESSSVEKNTFNVKPFNTQAQAAGLPSMRGEVVSELRIKQ